MNNFDLEKTLSTMTIICDSREHATPEAKKRWESFGSYNKHTPPCSIVGWGGDF